MACASQLKGLYKSEKRARAAFREYARTGASGFDGSDGSDGSDSERDKDGAAADEGLSYADVLDALAARPFEWTDIEAMITARDCHPEVLAKLASLSSGWVCSGACLGGPIETQFSPLMINWCFNDYW